MKTNEQQYTWDDIKNSWNLSSEVEDINILMNELSEELKYWSSPFEQDAIKKDIILIKGAISKYEKDMINKEIRMIEQSITNLEKGVAKSVSNFMIKVVKKIISIIKVKND
ncbi:hypothetical protein [Winogradskyella sp.]|jgi:hypothetical protein|uniref:hypothetical protein n=1 Tax=Winogradskyella sp. TaxID=1883156 RepID=UPI0025D00AF4|nr:hypothetical protein [Winogradskyella sp.]MCT4629034.1 hypothetical protein [Winogradskyella sp.]